MLMIHVPIVSKSLISLCVKWPKFYLFPGAIWYKSHYGPSIRFTIDTAKVNEPTCVWQKQQLSINFWRSYEFIFSFIHFMPIFVPIMFLFKLLSFILYVLAVKNDIVQNSFLWVNLYGPSLLYINSFFPIFWMPFSL